MQLGDTFIIEHLWIVVADPCKHSGYSIIVNITTDKNRAGTDCELNVGDHPWIKEKSHVSFGDAREVSPKEDAKIESYMASGAIKKHFPLGQSTLQKITVAAKKSKSLRLGFRKYFS
jgi:hypothetical protein